MTAETKTLQANTMAYYSSNIVPEWLDYVYSDLSRSTQFPFGAARALVVQRSLADHPPHGTTAYDIGCGGGQLSELLINAGFDVVGLDFSEAMLEEARKVVRATGSDQRLTLRRFDFVNDEIGSEPRRHMAVAMGFIEYLDDIQLFFAKSADMLLRDGRLLVEFRSRIFNSVTGNRFTLEDSESGLLRRGTDELQKFCSSAKLAPEHFKELGIAYGRAMAAIERTPEPPSGSELSQFFPTPRNQHFVSDVCEAAENFGFKLIDLYGLHPHPFVPALEKEQEWRYNQIAWQLQQFASNPLIMSTCSSLAALFERG